MAEILLVRHGQASFGSDDYDRLSELGWQQSRWLGDYFAERRIGFSRVICGALRRHHETLTGIRERCAIALEPETHPGLNEYDGEDILQAYSRRSGEQLPERNADRRAHFRMLRRAMHAWSAGELDGLVNETWAVFTGRIAAAIAVAATTSEGRILVVTSGGPIAATVAATLRAAASSVIDLNLQTRNSGLTQLFTGRDGTYLASFNAIPHLDRPDRLHALTFS